MDAELAQPCITAGRKIKCRLTVCTFKSFQWLLIGAEQGERQADYSND
jgi:hypothetical protein